jgi:2-methylcitrate dehydratase PrpD
MGLRSIPVRPCLSFESLNLKENCTSWKPPKNFSQYALANGTFAKGIELDDIDNSSSLHPGPSVWPVALAMGRSIQDRKRLIPAVVLGYETIIRLGQAINYAEHYSRGFHPSSTCGHFAATVVASKASQSE